MQGRVGLAEMLRLMSYVSQFGMAVISPILVSVLVGVWVCSRFSVGPWLIVVLLIVGLISGGCGFYRFVRSFIEMEKKIQQYNVEGEWEDEN